MEKVPWQRRQNLLVRLEYLITPPSKLVLLVFYMGVVLLASAPGRQVKIIKTE